MRAFTSRAGLTLIELIVALLLTLVLLGVGSLVARRSLRTAATLSTAELRNSALSDALRTLVRHAANVEPMANDLRSASDSVLDLLHAIGMATVCTARADTLVLVAADGAPPWGAVLPRGVTVDDAIRVWNDDDQRWTDHGLRTVGAAAGACGDSTTILPARAGQRLIIDDSLRGVRPGAVVRVLQRERWSLLRGGDGQWSLSLATWDAGSRNFSTPQPLVTALADPAAPSGPGFTIRAVDRANRRLADSALAQTRAIIVWLRTATHPRLGTTTDSVRINVGAH